MPVVQRSVSGKIRPTPPRHGNQDAWRRPQATYEGSWVHHPGLVYPLLPPVPQFEGFCIPPAGIHGDAFQGTYRVVAPGLDWRVPGVGVGVDSGVGSGVGVGVGVGLGVGAGVGVGVSVGTGVGKGVGVGRGVGVGSGAGEGVGSGVGSGAGMGVWMAVGVGDRCGRWQVC